jgi:hypothetical protein
VSGAICLELNARGKSIDRHIGIVPKLDGQNVTREIPWRWRDPCCGPEWGPRRSKPFQHFIIPTAGSASAMLAVSQRDSLRPTTFVRLGRACDDLAIFAPNVSATKTLRKALSRAHCTGAPSREASVQAQGPATLYA